MAGMDTAATSRVRRREDPKTRRAQILEAARCCFTSIGFQAASVDRIAAEAGVSVGLLYRFFKSKGALIEAIVVEDAESQLIQFGALIDSSPAGNFSIAHLVKNNLAQAAPDRERMALMFDMAAELCRNPSLQSFVQQRRAALKASLAEKLIERGLARQQVDQALQSLDLAGAVASGLALHALMSGDVSLDQSLERLGGLIETGLAPDGK
jgi:AcrR family transcriptional regulator